MPVYGGGVGVSEVTVFICGKSLDHVCDTDGPTLYGGDDVPTITDQSKAGKGYTWGSVSCSKCGNTAMENSMRNDWDLR